MLGSVLPPPLPPALPSCHQLLAFAVNQAVYASGLQAGWRISFAAVAWCPLVILLLLGIVLPGARVQATCFPAKPNHRRCCCVRSVLQCIHVPAGLCAACAGWIGSKMSGALHPYHAGTAPATPHHPPAASHCKITVCGLMLLFLHHRRHPQQPVAAWQARQGPALLQNGSPQQLSQA
jgi:hypothetical protein